MPVTMKKIVLIAILVALLPFLSIAVVNADPVWGTGGFGPHPWVNFKITPSGLHIVSDPLFAAPSGAITPFDPSAASLVKGWINYICDSDNPLNEPTGLEFSITGKDLSRGKYDVKAYPTTTVIPGVGEVDSSDLGDVTSYMLGTLKVGGKGEGELKGFVDLDAGFYAWRIAVEQSGNPILETHFADPVDFDIVS
jgi:hypothetical protein